MASCQTPMTHQQLEEIFSYCTRRQQVQQQTSLCCLCCLWTLSVDRGLPACFGGGGGARRTDHPPYIFGTMVLKKISSLTRGVTLTRASLKRGRLYPLRESEIKKVHDDRSNQLLMLLCISWKVQKWCTINSLYWCCVYRQQM